MVKSMDTIVNLCKARGYIYPGSEIYGGLSNTWDYGPLGVELKNNVKALWRKKFIQESKYNVGLDAAILMNPLVWVASGHVGGFSDPLIDCKECKTRHRADKLIEEWAHEQGKDMIADGMTDEEMIKFLDDNNICCPNCGKHNFTSIRKFNLMFKTFQGVTEDAKAEIYLRPETAQGIFVNFKNVMRTTRRKLPMGIAQIGKAFRNEITPGNFTFRTREFEQMELEFFCKPGTDLEWHEYWKKFCENWLISLGMKEENIRLRDHSPEELVFYSKATTDIEYAFPFGWGELWGIADRTDYDLSNHARQSNQDFTYLDPETNEKYIPYCIEPSLGADRVALAFLCNAYDEEEITEGDTRVVLHLHPALAPYKVAVLPLSKKLSDKGYGVHTLVMSATPIPRTLAIILYADMDISIIKELPKGRKPIKNCVVGTNYRQTAYQFIAGQIAEQSQVYVVCPMVEESETLDVTNVTEYVDTMRANLPAGTRIEMLHGQMRAEEKNEIMKRFSEGEIDVLVSTTVIEVGVNNPNATVMMVENAERFGLAQLHQLRGRVGRGKKQSYCIFINGKESEESMERLRVLENSNDGFFIASEDLKLRGPGDFFGIRQSGDALFELADIYNHADMLQLAQDMLKKYGKTIQPVRRNRGGISETVL